MDILVLSACIGDEYFTDGYQKFVLSTLRKYCDKHSFDLQVLTDENKADEERALHWIKIAALREKVDNYDWLVWFDSDVMIMNHNINLKRYLDHDVNLIITRDFMNSEETSDHSRLLNTGVMFWKGKSDKSKEMLDSVYYDDNTFVKNPQKFPFEQGSLCTLYKKDPKFRSLTKVDENNEFHKFWFRNSEELKLENVLLNTDLKSNPDKFQKILLEDNKIFKVGDFCVHFAPIYRNGPGSLTPSFRKLYNNVIWN